MPTVRTVPSSRFFFYATLILQAILALLGLGVLVFLLWEPHLEGVNAHATTFEIYFKDPFLAYAYTGSISFFVGLYQAFKVLGFVRRNETFSLATVKALRIIKYCAIVLIAFAVGAEAHSFIFVRGKDDISGGVAIGLFVIVASSVVTAVAARFEMIVSNCFRSND